MFKDSKMSKKDSYVIVKDKSILFSKHGVKGKGFSFDGKDLGESQLKNLLKKGVVKSSADAAKDADAAQKALDNAKDIEAKLKDALKKVKDLEASCGKKDDKIKKLEADLVAAKKK